MDVELILTRGLPASGKSTWAHAEVDRIAAECGPGHLVRINRDDFRRMMLESTYSAPQFVAEQRVTAARDAAVAAALADGTSVVCDDTNLRAKYVRSLMEIARRIGASVRFVDFTDVPPEECVRRDARRSGVERVGEDVIRELHRRFLAGRAVPLPVPEPSTAASPDVKPYVAPVGAPRAVLCDLDGTLALLNRSPYDETLVSTDRVNEPVLRVLESLVASGLVPVFMSGRTEGCRTATEAWLTEHARTSAWPELYMRAVGDQRSDAVVKAELFDRHVRDRYDVQMVLDDRTQVVAVWRSMGLTCLQVAEGNF